jgi:hypothetical protein
MRRQTLVLAVLLAGCGADNSADSSPSATDRAASSTSGSAPADAVAQTAYLAELRAGTLLGQYTDAELVALGLAFCDNRRQGQEPIVDGRATGDGAYQFPEVGDPVYAVDAIDIDLQAQEYFCLGEGP